MSTDLLNPPDVSVLMPVHNAAATIRDCIQSILQQSLQSFELIIVNDHSDDKSIDIAASFNDRRIKILDATSRGIVSALNTGLNFCSSDYVARMDADDLMRPLRLEKQYRLMRQRDDLGLCATQAEKFPLERIQAGYVEYMRWQNACLTDEDVRNDIYIESPFAHPSVMFRKTVVDRLGGYRDGAFPEDYELWLRLHQAGTRMEKLPEVLLDWRESDTRLSRVSERYSDEAFNRLRAEYLAKDSRLANREIVFWGAGRKTRLRAQHLIDKGVKPMAWIDIDKKKVGNIYHDAVTHYPDWLQQQAEGGDKPLVLNYVRNHGARDYCRQFLNDAGYKMGVDYLDVA